MTTIETTAPRSEIRTLTHDEALAELNTQKGRYSTHSTRAANNVMYTEGKEPINPAFTFESENAGATCAWENIVRLKTALALANAKRHIEWEGRKRSLAEGVILQSELLSEITRLRGLVINEQDETRMRQRRTPEGYTEEEVVIKHRSRMTERERTNRVEALETRRRALTAAINRVNKNSTVTVELLLE